MTRSFVGLGDAYTIRTTSSIGTYVSIARDVIVCALVYLQRVPGPHSKGGSAWVKKADVF